MAKGKTNEMPHNLEAEQSLLACIIIDKEVQVEVLSSLSVEDFYSESHKNIFEAMRQVNERNIPIDLVTLTDELEKSATLTGAGGISYIAQLSTSLPSAANYKYYLEIVQRDSILRKLIKSSNDIIQNATESADKDLSMAFAEKKIFDISQSVDTSSMVKIGEVVPVVIEKFNAINKDKNAFQGIKTGFHKLDYMLNGLHKTDLILLAARPAMGKTSLAMNIVENIAVNEGKVCAVFSLEMGKEQLAQRMVCSLAEVSMQDALKANLDKEKWSRLMKAQAKLSESKIFIDDSSMITASEILSKCRRMKRKYGLDLVMIDYLQLMNGSNNKNSDNRQQQIAEISRSLKILAKEVEVPVIALSQLSRSVEQRSDHKPQLSDLRESGAIEQDADIVMFIHRPDKSATDKERAEGKVQENVAELLIEKHRNGPTGSVKLYFNGGCTKFLNIEDAPKVEVKQETPEDETSEDIIEIDPNIDEINEDDDIETVDGDGEFTPIIDDSDDIF